MHVTHMWHLIHVLHACHMHTTCMQHACDTHVTYMHLHYTVYLHFEYQYTEIPTVALRMAHTTPSSILHIQVNPVIPVLHACDMHVTHM